MKVKMYSDGHGTCPECGERFSIQESHVGILNSYMTLSPTCDHNYGSWVAMTPDAEFKYPVAVDLGKARRSLEDRLRKDEAILKKVLFMVAWADDHKGIKEGWLESQLEKI